MNGTPRRVAILAAAALTFTVGAASGNAYGEDRDPAAPVAAGVDDVDTYLTMKGSDVGVMAEMQREKILRLDRTPVDDPECEDD